MDWLITGAFSFIRADIPAIPPSGLSRAAVPTETDLELVRLCYDVMAAGLGCSACPAPLGRDLYLVAPADAEAPTWQVIVVMRCRGWRRHRHTAVVAEVGGNLHFGPVRGRNRAKAQRVSWPGGPSRG
ncbi:hypothetical protein [Paractinoplanes maris]|uniref:hypothetical protein n=1 Tax=Paractinoplanes maris TaxID=1734446 RepID=UPI002021C662|nr:hypothetical protein [Actinoplanes maris]